MYTLEQIRKSRTMFQLGTIFKTNEICNSFVSRTACVPYLGLFPFADFESGGVNNAVLWNPAHRNRTLKHACSGTVDRH